MSHYVYILKSKIDNKLYVGSTGYLDLRLEEHSSGTVKSTRNRRPLELIYKEKFEDKSLCLKRERFFKTGRGRKVLENLRRGTRHCGVGGQAQAA